MKHLTLFILLIICSIQTYCQITQTKRFSISDFSLRDTLCPDNQTYSYFPGYSDATLGQSGQPALPLVPVNLLVPTGSFIDSITVQGNDISLITLSHKIFPFQAPLPTCIGCPIPGFTTIDSTIYLSNLKFPALNFLSYYGYWHKAQILTIDICPFGYLPVSNQMEFMNSVTINVYYRDKEGEDGTQNIKMTRAFYSEFINDLSIKIANPESIEDYVKGIDIIESKPKTKSSLPDFDYVVIAPSDFINTAPMNTFIEWKKKKGVDIGVIALSEAYNYVDANNINKDNIGNENINYPNNQDIEDNAAKLRMYLKAIYDSGGCREILLVGNQNKIPVRKYYAEHGNDSDYPPTDAITDKYYADFNSDYAVDGDPKLGEITTSLTAGSGDKVDLLSEAYIGRIPSATIGEFGVWVDKLMSYETNPGDGDANYLNGFLMTMADGPQASILTSTYENLNIFNPVTIFKELPLYNSPIPNAPHGEDIISYFNSSPAGWWTWDNHGSPTYFVTMSHNDNGFNWNNGPPTMSTINSSSTSIGLLSLHNYKKYGIISSNCCDVANFEVNNNMLVSSLLNSNGGSVAMAGNTDLGWYPAGESKLDKLTSVIKDCHEGTNQTQIRYCSADWAWFINKNPYTYGFYETYLTNNYFGDPDMIYYTKEPVRFIAEVTPRHIGLDTDNSIVVTIKNLSFKHKATVCLYQASVTGDGFQEVQEIDGLQHGDQTATFNILANTLTTGVLYVTVSGFNYMPYTDEILVSPGCAYNANATEHITSSSLTWQQIRFKDHDVIIDSLATLTIIGEVYFVPEAKLIVKPGGKLIINGGKLGTSCEALWKGVEVLGHSNLTQYSNTNQGFVQVTNSGSIQDAKAAISTAQSTTNGFVAGTSGGTFSCTNAKFLNNKCSIHVYPYQYQNDNYNSNISRTSFTMDDKYIGEPDGSPMVLLDGIKGLGMTGLTFANLRPPGGAPVSRGIGIKASNSGFRLNQICTNAYQQPCNEYIKPSFTGLFYGIHCLSTSAAKFVQVEHTNFIGNDRGIYLSAVVNPSITQCYFKTKTGTGMLPSSGLYLDHCTGYSIQENSFEGCNNGGTTFDYGIVVNSSGTAPNEIYNNAFTSFQYGIAAQDTNRNPVNGVGLVCKCNDFSSNKTDQAVLIFSSSNTYKGIALYQGDSLSITGPAGNTFSQRSIGSGTYDLYNQGVRFKYYHQPNAQSKRLKPEPQLCTNVYIKQWNAYPYDKTTSCPSKLNSGGSNLEGMKIELQSTSTNVQQKETELQAMVDGGTTVQTTEDIAYSTPSEALLLHDELLMKSPYLSDTVMQSAVANEFVLPNVMIRDILVANPQSASSEPVLNELDKRIEPMPEDMYNQILDAESAYSPLEIREMELASLKAKQSWLFNSVVTNYLSDTTGSVDDSLKVVLQNTPFPEGRYLLALKQMAENDTIAAASTLQAITTSLGLSDEQQSLHNDYLNYFEILKEMNRDTLPGTETDSIQTASLLTLMTNVNEPVKSYIQNILIANRVITYEEPYLFADELKASRIRKTNLINNEVNVMLQISPNPATGYFIVKYDLNNQIAPATIEVVSLHGQVLLSKQLNKNRDQFVVTLTGFSSGIYIVSIRARDRVLDNCRLIVIK